MHGKIFAVIVLAGSLLLPAIAGAEALKMETGDRLESLLSGQKGKRVTVKLGSGDELTGTVLEVGGKLVHLGELSGKEFFDAAIVIDEIAAVIIRVRDK